MDVSTVKHLHGSFQNLINILVDLNFEFQLNKFPTAALFEMPHPYSKAQWSQFGSYRWMNGAGLHCVHRNKVFISSVFLFDDFMLFNT